MSEIFFDDFCPPSTLTHFSKISLSALECTAATSKSFTCPLECIPTWFLKAVFQTVGPDILAIINCSLNSGIFPSNFKHSLVYLLLKKPSLDSSVLSNFRSISKLPFLSKILEKIVSTQLISFMNNNQLRNFSLSFAPYTALRLLWSRSLMTYCSQPTQANTPF